MTDADATPPADSGRPPGMPRWVKVSGIVILVLVAVLVVSKLAGIEHGPGRHPGSGANPGHTPPAGMATEHRPPAGAGGHTGPSPGVTHGAEE